MFGECHAHMIMDGVCFREAAAKHRNSPDEAPIRQVLSAYQKRNVLFIRDGGDNLGVSRLAADLAPEYGIDYRTPVFAIHRRGYYGGIVGFAYDSLKEYARLVQKARAKRCDFIKIMTAGIMDFDHAGRLSCPGLPEQEVAEMVHIAHSEGYSVMTHVNGADHIKVALEAGVDSIEHGNFMDLECLSLLKETGAVWCPTIAITGNIIGSGRYNDAVLASIHEQQLANIQRAFTLGATVALGSDAGAFRVPHPQGVFDEYGYFRQAVPDQALLDARLAEAEATVQERFRAGGVIMEN
ncbi:amidohydrolase family protein [Eubacterium limosum]|uniref:Amidohydrolase family protein n=1 Tax=Eubacterium limosum TaxID=1736 RepID=A0ABT5US99_EUBLI|nr:amidohydrolase family protein [Eubacterium limosum]MCB6570712.1 amidohydrolase family protein [Eubacterium limosum]MDE1471826.1 amidohydrolase family protein [Eubacterium limosum]